MITTPPQTPDGTFYDPAIGRMYERPDTVTRTYEVPLREIPAIYRMHP